MIPEPAREILIAVLWRVILVATVHFKAVNTLVILRMITIIAVKIGVDVRCNAPVDFYADASFCLETAWIAHHLDDWSYFYSNNQLMIKLIDENDLTAG